MIRKGFCLFVIVSSLLSGCALMYCEETPSWVGRSEETLLLSWGIPDSTYEISKDRKMLMYSNSDNAKNADIDSEKWARLANNNDPVLRGDEEAFFGGMVAGAKKRSRVCKTTFTIEKGVVIGWTWKGNCGVACVPKK